MLPATSDAAEPTTARRRSRLRADSSVSPARRKTFQLLLVFVTLVLVINALVGDRGLTETLRARRQHHDLVASIDRLKGENAQLRDQARRLRSDPAAIEALARRELGLIRPGELLFIIKDARGAKPNP
jgi:cell division protein FtsB